MTGGVDPVLIRTPFQLRDPGASARGWRHPPPGGDPDEGWVACSLLLGWAPVAGSARCGRRADR